MKGCKTAQDEDRENGLRKRKKDIGNGQRKWTRERGRTTAETKDTEKLQNKDRENSEYKNREN